MGQLERAIDDFDEVIRLNPQIPEAHDNRERTLTLLNMEAEVKQDVNPAAESGSDSVPSNE